jgi:hypothetical protein
MQTLGDTKYRELKRIAKDYDITIQELLRAAIIPDWLTRNGIPMGLERLRKLRAYA